MYFNFKRLRIECSRLMALYIFYMFISSYKVK